MKYYEVSSGNNSQQPLWLSTNTLKKNYNERRGNRRQNKEKGTKKTADIKEFKISAAVTRCCRQHSFDDLSAISITRPAEL